MRCGARALSLLSLGFGLIATGALSLAVATDYWLFTVEQITPEQNDTIAMEALYAEQLDINASEPPSDAVPFAPDGSSMLSIPISTHSGLWRLCIIVTDTPGACIVLYF